MALRQQIAGRVLVLTLDTPATKNALDRATITELRDLLEALAFRDPLPPSAGADGGAVDIGPSGVFRPHVILLRSTGPVFCAGAHLGEMKALGEIDYQENLAAALDMGAMYRALRGSPAPVVARVQGAAYGGGAGLAAACDLVVAGASAHFCFSEVKLGLVPGVISPLVVGRMGLGATRDAFLTARRLDAAEARRLGLVDREVADGELDAAVAETVTQLLQAGPAALGLGKSLLEGIESLGFARSAELSARMIAQARTQPEAQAALVAFFAKQAAPWQTDVAWTLPPEPPSTSPEETR